jgi:hypothetical protein
LLERSMNKLSPREVLADLLTSGDFLVEITADADRVGPDHNRLVGRRRLQDRAGRLSR